MPSVVSNKFRIHSAQQFKESFDEASNTVIYFYIGGPSPFPIDIAPPSPILTTANVDYSPWEDMTGLKRVYASDVSHVIPRYDWTSNTAYVAYDDKVTTLTTDKFYVVTDQYDVYKCLNNNNGALSVNKPTGTSTSPFSTADGYLWKFMYHVSTTDALKFLTTNYMPVKKLLSDDGTNQWTVQQAAVEGAIHRIKVTNGGSGYVSAPSVIITGDGTGANATAVLTSNSVSSITVNNVGSGYTRATISFSGGSGANAAATAIISPKGGHGSDPVEELGGNYLLINTKLDGSELITSNEFRKIGLIRDPYAYGTTNVSYANTHNQTFRYTVSSITGTFSVDQTLTSGSNNATIVDWDSSNNYIYATLANPKTFANGATLSTSTGSATITAITNPGLQPFSGDILYVEYRSPIQRAPDQIEDVKLIIQF